MHRKGKLLDLLACLLSGGAGVVGAALLLLDLALQRKDLGSPLVKGGSKPWD